MEIQKPINFSYDPTHSTPKSPLESLKRAFFLLLKDMRNMSPRIDKKSAIPLGTIVIVPIGEDRISLHSVLLWHCGRRVTHPEATEQEVRGGILRQPPKVLIACVASLGLEPKGVFFYKAECKSKKPVIMREALRCPLDTWVILGMELVATFPCCRTHGGV